MLLPDGTATPGMGSSNKTPMVKSSLPRGTPCSLGSPCQTTCKVLGTDAVATSPQVLGNIQITGFINPAGLQAIGNNLFIESAASGAPQTGTPGQNGLPDGTTAYTRDGELQQKRQW